MPLIFMQVNARLKNGIELLNSLDYQDFIFILNRVCESQNEQMFTADDLNKLQESSKLDDTSLQLLMQSVAHIFKQSSKFILKPTVLRKELTDELKIEPLKADEFVKKWTEQTKKNFGDLENRHKVENVLWQLNVEAASTSSNKQKIPSAKIQLNLTSVKDDSQSDVILDLSEEELIHLYNTLENLQVKLDVVNDMIRNVV